MLAVVDSIKGKCEMVWWGHDLSFICMCIFYMLWIRTLCSDPHMERRSFTEASCSLFVLFMFSSDKPPQSGSIQLATPHIHGFGRLCAPPTLLLCSFFWLRFMIPVKMALNTDGITFIKMSSTTNRFYFLGYRPGWRDWRRRWTVL